MSRFRMLALLPALVLAAACGGNADTSNSLAKDPVKIDVADVDNAVDPPLSVHKVPKGREIVISVYSTVADVVHVHGYEKMGTVSPGAMVQVSFTADKTGRFDVDMQRTHVKLLRLQVS